MFKIVIASHGPFADAMKKSVNLFFPEEKEIITINIGEDGLVPFQKRLDKILKNINGQSVLFLVDLPYGTPFNEIAKRMTLVKKDSDILAGVNMPTLIEAINLRNQRLSIKEILPQLFEVSRLQSYSERVSSLGNVDNE